MFWRRKTKGSTPGSASLHTASAQTSARTLNQPPAQPPAHPPAQPPTLGDVLASPDGRSRALVVKIDHPGASDAVFPEVVVHVMGVHFDGSFFGHFPFAPEALAPADIIGRMDPDDERFPDSWKEGRGIWADAVREGAAGIFTVPIEAVF